MSEHRSAADERSSPTSSARSSPTDSARRSPADRARRSAAAPMSADWMAEARCRDHPPSVFFPSDGVGVEVARRICADCPVRLACLEYALRNGIDHGVWGGTSERERRRIARRRRLATLRVPL